MILSDSCNFYVQLISKISLIPNTCIFHKIPSIFKIVMNNHKIKNLISKR